MKYLFSFLFLGFSLNLAAQHQEIYLKTNLFGTGKQNTYFPDKEYHQNGTGHMYNFELGFQQINKKNRILGVGFSHFQHKYKSLNEYSFNDSIDKSISYLDDINDMFININYGAYNSWKKFSFYSIAILSIGCRYKSNSINTQTNFNKKTKITSEYISSSTRPKYYSTDLGISQGAYYNIYKNLSIGGDFGFSFRFVYHNGKFTTKKMDNGVETITISSLNGKDFYLITNQFLGIRYRF